MQATLTQEPPIHCRSTTAVRRPDCAMCQATSLPPVPLPSTRTSNRSGWDMRIPFAGRTLMDNICAQTAVPYLLQSAHYYVIAPIIAQARRRLERLLQIARGNKGFRPSTGLITIVLVAGIRSDRFMPYADRFTAPK